MQIQENSRLWLQSAPPPLLLFMFFSLTYHTLASASPTYSTMLTCMSLNPPYFNLWIQCLISSKVHYILTVLEQADSSQYLEQKVFQGGEDEVHPSNEIRPSSWSGPLERASTYPLHFFIGQLSLSDKQFYKSQHSNIRSGVLQILTSHAFFPK